MSLGDVRKEAVEVGMKKGMEVGIKEGTLIVGKKMLELGLSEQQIFEATGFTVNEIKELSRGLK